MLNSLRGPILAPRPDGTVDFFRDGVLQWDDAGVLTFVGDFADAPPAEHRRTTNLILPPFIDAHIHIPQWPIRGQFCDGVVGSPPEGRLLAGLNRNVFPFESRCASTDHTAEVVASFAADTLANGVVGGAAFMTVHAEATHHSLATLRDLWSVGLVLMNMNCPEFLRTDEANLDRDIDRLAGDFGRRFIVTDRFAVAVDSPLRQRAAKLAATHGLRMQTHLDEQLREKQFVEQALYPHYASYTDVYRRDGLLDREPILAHCIHMTDAELQMLAESGACVAHCPTSNTLLGSGIMNVDRMRAANIEYAICTDVGASPTTSMLHEMAQYLFLQGGAATPSDALQRATLVPAKLLNIDHRVGRLEVGRPASFIEVAPSAIGDGAADVDDVIAIQLLGASSVETPGLERARAALARGGLQEGPELDLLTAAVNASAAKFQDKVRRAVLDGRELFAARASRT